MCVISYLSGFLPFAGKVTIDWYWLLLLPAVGLMWLFSTGCAFLVARWVALAPDLDNLLPHFMRVLMYASGVIFSIDRYLGQFSWRSEEHTSELQSRGHLVCRLLLEKKKETTITSTTST